MKFSNHVCNCVTLTLTYQFVDVKVIGLANLICFEHNFSLNKSRSSKLKINSNIRLMLCSKVLQHSNRGPLVRCGRRRHALRRRHGCNTAAAAAAWRRLRLRRLRRRRRMSSRSFLVVCETMTLFTLLHCHLHGQ